MEGEKEVTDDNNDDNRNLFIEIRPEETSKLPRLVEVYVAQVEPQQCRGLLKVLSVDLPLAAANNNGDEQLYDLSHLKRVQKSMPNHQSNKKEDAKESPQKKKHKPEVVLSFVSSFQGYALFAFVHLLLLTKIAGNIIKLRYKTVTRHS